jgi:hypothetical protein
MHPSRAVLEIRYYGRVYFDWLPAQQSIWSLLFLLFIRTSGYIKTYHGLKGFYVAAASQKRRRPAKTFTLTTTPHGASRSNVIQTFAKDIK